MFKGVVVERGRCDHCLKEKLTAYIPPTNEDGPYQVAYGFPTLKLCSGCIYALMRTAAMLAGFERPAKSAKAKKAPKKARKPGTSQPRPDADYQGPSKHEVSSLVPVNEEVSP